MSYASLPLGFEANQGQSDERVKFLARGQGYSLFLTSTEAVLSLRPLSQRLPSATDHASTGPSGAGATPAAVVRMRLVGANPDPQVSGLEALPGRSNYFIGNPDRWRRDVPSYARVKYAGVYPGVDVVYYGNQRQLEYDVVVAPGADPARIELAFEGVQAISIDPDGNLVLQTSQGEIVQHEPVIHQDIGGRRQRVEGRYALRATDRVGFDVARYDTTQPLVIDPVLTYSTYLGGSANDIGRAIAVDSAGNAYVTGEANSTNFPGASTSAIQPTSGGSYDVFVTKLNAAGNAVVYSTYLGGSGVNDLGRAIAVDGAGNAYVTGETDSLTFPKVGAFQASYGLGGDAFITKINAAGNALVYSTYLGGSGFERGYGIAVDGSGNAYVTGHTNSAGNFPTAVPFQSQNGGSVDAFVTKFNATGSALLYSTYLGGSASEFSLDGGGIAVDGAGSAYVAGTTASTNFPGASASTIQATNAGGTNDGFVVKFNPAGSALVYSTYLGGSGIDAVNAIAIDPARNAYVAGNTDSPNFPTVFALQPSRNGLGSDAFVAKLNPAGSALAYSTYLGGSGAGDAAFDVAVDGSGNAYVAGFTNSSNFPTVSPIPGLITGLGDAFVSEFNAAGNALVYSSYLGGSAGSERCYGIALDGAGNTYVTGETNSTNFPTVGPFQATLGGAGSDAFIAKIGSGVYLLTVAKTGSGSGTVTSTTPAGAINCGGTCSASFNLGTVVTLNASPATGSVFGGWSGGGCSGTGACAVTMTAATTVTATFVSVFTISGRVSDLNETPIAGVTIALSGSRTDSRLTDAAGEFAFAALPAGGTYTVTPSLAGFVFNPPSQTFPNLAADQRAVFFTATTGIFRRYFAEGATGEFFDTEFAILNATQTAALVTMRFQRNDGVEIPVSLALGPEKRATIDPEAIAGLTAAEFSTIVESNVPVIADRTMRWDPRQYGSHAETSIESPATLWYLAEGATINEFDLFYLIQNPNATAATLQVRYLLPAPALPIVKTYTVDPRSRFNIWVNLVDPALDDAEVSAVVTSTNNVPVIVERAMYRPVPGQKFGAGHESAGVTALATQWFLAEGATGPFFDLFILVANPNNSAAQLQVQYLLPSGQVIVKTYTSAANSRFNIWVDREGPELANTAVSAIVTSTNNVGIIVERAMWWPGETPSWYEGHNTAGAVQTGTKWGLAEGESGGTFARETYILIANTSPFAGMAKVTLLFEDGTRAERTYPLTPNSRLNVAAANDFPQAVNRRFGAIVESLGQTPAQIVVERAVYSNAQGIMWAAGTNALGTRLRGNVGPVK